jgi:hypothetical protein
MAFGIDDLLGTASATINLADTVVGVVQSNESKPGELRLLIAEIGIEVIQQIDEMHDALNRFERLLKEKGTLERPLEEAIAETPFWKPVEAFRLRRANEKLTPMADSLFRSAEDIMALVRCAGDVQDTGRAIVGSAKSKNAFNKKFLNAESVAKKIHLLRGELDRFKAALGHG